MKQENRDGDDTLATAMIWALSIGIVIVIATLILTRPAPETFSELYFNDHQSLPRYVNLNTTYPFSFSIANRETKNTTYEYIVSTETYSLKYGCENPTLYLEPKENMTARVTETDDPLLYVKEDNYTISFDYWVRTGQGTIETIMAEPNAPDQNYIVQIDDKDNKAYMLIKGKRYEEKLNSTEQLRHRVTIEVKYPTLTPKYFNTTKTTMVKDKKGKLVPKNVTVQNKTMVATNVSTITVKVDGQKVLNATTKKAYTKGFLSLGMIDTYADISNMAITREKTKQPVKVTFSDAKYQTIELTEIQRAEQNVILKATLLPELITEDSIPGFMKDAVNQTQTTTETMQPKQYSAQAPINFTSYTLSLGFRFGADGSLVTGIEDLISITYGKNQSDITIASKDGQGWKTESKAMLKPALQNKEIITIIDNNAHTAKIYIDGQLVTTRNISTDNIQKPFLQITYGKPVIWDFAARNNEKPEIYSYKLPDTFKQVKVYDDIHTSEILTPLAPINTTEKNDTEYAQELAAINSLEEFRKYLFDNNKINWTQYKITAEYTLTQPNSTIELTFTQQENLLYKISINQLDNRNSTILLEYPKGNSTYNETRNIIGADTPDHQTIVDVNGASMTINMDGKEIIKQNLTYTTEGVLFLDYSKSIVFPKLQIENKEDSQVKIYKNEQPKCSPVLIKDTESTETVLIQDKDIKTFNSTAYFKEKFDIGKVQVTLRKPDETANSTQDKAQEQEIHFWVVNT